MTLYGVNFNIVCMTIYIPGELNPRTPKYKAIADAIERDIFSGRLQPGTQLPPHRELADALAINVSTVTRAYGEARSRGLLSGTVGRGTFVAADADTDTCLVPLEPHAPGMVEMGLVAPLYAQDPDAGAELARLSRGNQFNRFFKYTSPAGLAEHQRAGVIWARRYGMVAPAENIVVTAGAQHALTCALISLFTRGDRVAVEALSYPALKALAQMLGIGLTPVEMDDQGMVPQALDRVCRRDAVQGVFLMPSCQNPTTACMDAERREEMARVIARHRLLLLEDDTYALTRPELAPEAPKNFPISARIPDHALFIAAISKAFLPGLRTAFVVVPRQLRKPFTQAVLNTIWMAPTLNAALAAAWITNGTAERVIQAKQAEARRRRDRVLSRLQDGGLDKTSGPKVQGHGGSFVLWRTLPRGMDSHQLELAARKEGLNIFCAQRFAVGSDPVPQALRLSLTGPESLEELDRGMDILTRPLG